jgi:four helix bundle protein
LPQTGIRALVDQLLRSGTSIGANLEEAKAASTKREFLRDVEVSLREAREAWYWLRIYTELQLGDPATVVELVNEADTIVRILTSIVISTKRRMITIAVVSAFCILNSALLFSS